MLNGSTKTIRNEWKKSKSVKATGFTKRYRLRTNEEYP